MRRAALPLTVSLAIAALCGCGASRRLGDFGVPADFTLTSQTGRSVTLAELRGKVWVADTFFTTCTGPCPMMSAKMQRLARETPQTADVRFVSLTVDPAQDSPAALLAYSEHFHADPARWLFLTGDLAALNRVTMDGLHLSRVDGSLEHSTEFALVDRKTHVRGYYFPFEQKQFEKLISDIRYLAGS